MEFGIPPDGLTLHLDDEVLVCDREATIPVGSERGYIVKDTRLVSGYRVLLGGSVPVLLKGASAASFSARFEFTNPTLVTAQGQIEATALHLRIDRTVGGGVHEDYDVTNFARSPVELDLEVHIECDFADVFDLRQHVVGRRGIMQSTWDEKQALLVTTYRNGPFVRALEVVVENCDSPTEFANGSLIFRLQLAPGASWHSCLKWLPRLPDRRRPTSSCHGLVDGTEAHLAAHQDWVSPRHAHRGLRRHARPHHRPLGRGPVLVADDAGPRRRRDLRPARGPRRLGAGGRGALVRDPVRP